MILSTSEPSPTSTKTIPIKATFNESVTGFDSTDISLVNGTLRDFSGSEKDYIFNLFPTNDGIVTVQVVENAATNSLTRGNFLSEKLSIEYRSRANVIITSTKTSPTNSRPIPFTATFDYDMTGFVESEIKVTNGDVKTNSLTGTGKTYNFEITPRIDGAVIVEIGENSAVDANNNGNKASQPFTIIYDSSNPMVVLSTIANFITSLSNVPLKAKFNESVIGFNAEDINITNASISNFSGSDSLYSFDVIPTAYGEVTIDIAQGGASDSAGNTNDAATQLSFLFDINYFHESFDSLNAWTNTVLSTEYQGAWSIDSIGYDGTSAKSNVEASGHGDRLTKTFIFDSQSVISLWAKRSANDSIKLFIKGRSTTDANNNFDILIDDPDTNFTSRINIVEAGEYDINIETNEKGTIWIDELKTFTNTRPLVFLSSLSSPATNSLPIDVDIHFSAAVSDFYESDIQLQNATVADFYGADQDYNVELDPSSEGEVIISIGENVATDNSGKGNFASEKLKIIYDISKPTLQLTTNNTITNDTSIVVNAIFNEKVTDFKQENITVNNGTVKSLSAKEGTDQREYLITLSPLIDGILAIDVKPQQIKDIAGNPLLEDVSIQIISDRTKPSVGIVYDGSNDDIDYTNITSTFEANWSSFIDTTSGIQFYEWAIGTEIGDSSIQTWRNIGKVNYIKNDSITLLHGGKYFASVRAADLAGNISDIVSSDGVIIDTLSPATPNLKLEEGEKKITLSWSSLSDVNHYNIHRSNENYFTPNVNTLFKQLINRETTFIDTSLEFGLTYFYRLQAIDYAGNQSEYSDVVSGSPQDYTAPIVKIITPSLNDKMEVGTNLSISWTASDNYKVDSTFIVYTIDEGNTWNNIVGLSGDVSDYIWEVPNKLTQNLWIKVIAYDGAGLSGENIVNGLEIFFVYPKIEIISPLTESINWNQKSLALFFTRDMDSSSFTSNSVKIESKYSTIGSFKYEAIQKVLRIKSLNSFSSLDTISITLNGEQIKSKFGYKLDGDGDGVGGDNFQTSFNVSMLADYDTSYTIDVIDLSYFLAGISNNNLSYELGPVEGKAPNFVSVLDSKFDIEDVMSFVMMWNWYVTSDNAPMGRWIATGEFVSLGFDHSGIHFQLPINSSAAEVQILGLNGQLEYHQSKDSSKISISQFDKQKKLFSFLSETDGGRKLEIPYKIIGKRAGLEVSYRFVDKYGNVLSQGTEAIMVENIPDDFSLEDNYPNPFNPWTMIDYSIPSEVTVELIVYDILGREVIRLVDEIQKPGYKSVIWNGRDMYNNEVGSGVYFYQLSTDNFKKTRKMIFMK